LDDNKKPGQRDISDLKARLGLKKTAAMPAVTPAGTPQQPQAPQGIPAPIPSAGSGPSAGPSSIPSPFGQPAPQPQAAPAPAPPPDPRRDPFAQQQAANLAAFYGVGQVLPGSAEGVSDAPLSKPKPWGRIGFVVGLCAIVFGVGNACGRIYGSRVEFNRTIDQAGQIREEVDKLSKQLNNIADTINASKATQQSQPDFDMSKKLGDLDLKKPDSQKIFHTNYMHLEDVAIERLFTYYDHTIKLYDLITLHAKKTENDKEAIENYMKNGAGKGDKNYGVTLDFTGAIPLAHFVEVGTPVCATPDKTDCNANELKGFKYRSDSGGSWADKPVKGKPGEIVVPMQKSPLFTSVAAGNPDILAYKDYLRRVIEIKGMAGGLVAEQKDVITDLKRAAERPKVFTF
jgi:hypothetical protein